MYYFIVNPHSRTGRGEIIWKMVKDELIRLNIKYKVTFTMCVGHAREIARELSGADMPVTIVAIGGDGTINEILSGLVSFEHVVLGYIPTGSGNDFAKGMGIPLDTMDALYTILNSEQTLSMDVGCIEAEGNVHRFGVSAGMGFDAAICHEALVSPLKTFLNKLKLGKLTYTLIALKQLFIYTPTTITLEMDGGRRMSYPKAYFAAVLNQKCEGGGLRLCPKSQPDDHILDICVVEGISKWKILFMLPSAFFAKHIHIKGVHILRCQNITLHSSSPVAIHRDGESNGSQEKIKIYLEKFPLKVIIPML